MIAVAKAAREEVSGCSVGSPLRYRQWMVVPITLSDVESVVGASGRVMVAPPGTPGSRMPLTVAIRGHQLAVCEQDAETSVPAGCGPVLAQPERSSVSQRGDRQSRRGAADGE